MERDRVIVVCPEGDYMTTVSTAYAEKATARGEVAWSDDWRYVVVIPKPINELDGATKRRLALAKERKKRR